MLADAILRRSFLALGYGAADAHVGPQGLRCQWSVRETVIVVVIDPSAGERKRPTARPTTTIPLTSGNNEEAGRPAATTAAADKRQRPTLGGAKRGKTVPEPEQRIGAGGSRLLWP